MDESDMAPDTRAHAIMNRASFSPRKKKYSIIWAAKYQLCPTCEARPLEPCLHMGELKFKAREHVKRNSTPHQDRVDWELLIKTLNERGFW
jgi:hypothetical protein